MPPNRGKGQFIVDAAATLSIHDVVGHPSLVGKKLSSPYPPLTTTAVEDNAAPTSSVEQKALNEKVEAKGEVAVIAPSVSTVPNNIISSDAADIVEKVLQDEQVRNLFSIEHIEANLVVAAATQKELNTKKSDEEQQQQKAVVVDNSNHDDYWAEEQFTEEEKEEGAGVPLKKFITARYLSDSTHPQQSYWDWPEAGNENTTEKKKETIIENIVLEEKCRELFSIEHIEKTLLEQCTLKDTTTTTTTSEMMMMTSHHDTTSAAYWEWTTTSSDDNVIEEESKEEIIHRILQEENIRQLFSVNHYETNLVLGNNHFSNEKKEKKNTASETKYNNNDDVDYDAYWDWNGSTTASTTTKIAPKSSHPNESYWDWDATDDNYNETKKNRIIQNILEEEKIRQSLSIMHIQEQLVTNATSAGGQQKTPICATNAATDTEKGGGGYWDM